MPPTQRITKAMILEAGFEIARREGIENVNSRNIARELSCSTQPVFSSFATMEELRKSVFDFACVKFANEVSEKREDPAFLSLSTKWYLNLLRNEPNLYKLLYFSDGFDQSALHDLTLKYTSNRAIVSKLQDMYSIDEAVCEDILLRAFAFLHGIGALVFFNSFEIGDSEIADMVKQTVAEMVLSAQNAKGERKK